MKAYMQVAHALLAWHIGPRHTASKASHDQGTRSGHTQYNGTRSRQSHNHGNSSGHSHYRGRRNGQSTVQRLPDQQQQSVSPHVDAPNMQPVTDRCNTRDSAEESNQMQQPGASFCSSGFRGLPEDLSHQVRMDQPSQHDHMGQLYQQNVVHQMSHMLTSPRLDQQQQNPSDQLQNQSQHLHDCSDEQDQVQLSYSLDADLNCELDLESSAVSRLMGTTAAAGQNLNSHSDAGLHQISGCFRGSEAAADESQTSLAVRTEKVLRLHVRSPCITVLEEMAESPSAAHGRRKQARLDSTRCLKF